MTERIIGLVLDESHWLPLAMVVSAIVVVAQARRHRLQGVPRKSSTLCGLNLFYGSMLGIMASGAHTGRDRDGGAGDAPAIAVVPLSARSCARPSGHGGWWWPGGGCEGPTGRPRVPRWRSMPGWESA